MTRSLALIHTVTSLAPTFERLVAAHLPDWTPFNIVDESLLRNTIRTGALTPQTMRRVAEHIWSAIDAGAEAVLVTCSSIGPAVDAAQPFCAAPLVRVDEGMADAALATGARIGVLATLATTLEPTRALVAERAARQSLNPKIIARLCEGAFASLAAGDREAHDASVRAGIDALARETDVIVLAQASMARVLDQGGKAAAPVLSSPELGVLRLKDILSRRDQGRAA